MLGFTFWTSARQPTRSVLEKQSSSSQESAEPSAHLSEQERASPTSPRSPRPSTASTISFLSVDGGGVKATEYFVTELKNGFVSVDARPVDVASTLRFLPLERTTLTESPSTSVAILQAPPPAPLIPSRTIETEGFLIAKETHAVSAAVQADSGLDSDLVNIAEEYAAEIAAEIREFELIPEETFLSRACGLTVNGIKITGKVIKVTTIGGLKVTRILLKSPLTHAIILYLGCGYIGDALIEVGRASLSYALTGIAVNLLQNYWSDILLVFGTVIVRKFGRSFGRLSGLFTSFLLTRPTAR